MSNNDSLHHRNRMMISKIITCQRSDDDDEDCSEITLESGDFDPEMIVSSSFGAVVNKSKQNNNSNAPDNNDTIPIMPLRRRIPPAFAQANAIPPAFAAAKSRTQRAGAVAAASSSSHGPRPLTRRSDRTSMYPSNSLYSKSTHTTSTTGASTTTTTTCSAATSAALNASISSATTFFDSPARLSQIREPASEVEGDDGEEECSFAADLGGGVAARDDPPSPPEPSPDKPERKSTQMNKNLCQRNMLQKSVNDEAVIFTPPLSTVEFEPETRNGQPGWMQRMEESQELSILTPSPQPQPRQGRSLLAEITKQKERDEEDVSRQPLRVAQRRASLQESSLVSVSPNRTAAAASASTAWHLNCVEHVPQPCSMVHATTTSSSSPSHRRSSMGAAKCSTAPLSTNRRGVTVRDRLRAFEP